ncbi:MAG: hypothetical protein WCS77_03810 [Elusimicrobiaceae bacterium]
MKTLIWGFAIFADGLLVQLLVWRFRRPQRQTKAMLLLMFGVALTAGLAFFLNPGGFSVFSVPSPQTPLETAHALSLTVSLILAWMITFSAVEADSPSLVIMRRIKEAGPAGLDKNDLYQYLNDELLLTPRIRDLITDKMAVETNGCYALTAKGARMTRLFIFWRKLFKLDKGG